MKRYSINPKILALLQELGETPYNLFQEDFRAIMLQNYSPSDLMGVITNPQTEEEKEMVDFYRFVYTWTTWEDCPK